MCTQVHPESGRAFPVDVTFNDSVGVLEEKVREYETGHTEVSAHVSSFIHSHTAPQFFYTNVQTHLHTHVTTNVNVHACTHAHMHIYTQVKGSKLVYRGQTIGHADEGVDVGDKDKTLASYTHACKRAHARSSDGFGRLYWLLVLLVPKVWDGRPTLTPNGKTKWRDSANRCEEA